MKRSILMLLFIGAALIFFGCEKETIQAPGSEKNDVEESALKGAKVKDKRFFEGICTPVDPANFIWYDAMDDWRVTGTTVWSYSDETRSGGTTILYVDAKNPHEENRGIWEMEWKFEEFNETEEGVFAVGVATGEGVSGKVKGMKATWTYTLDWEFAKPETFFYSVKGNIEKPQGPIKKN